MINQSNLKSDAKHSSKNLAASHNWMSKNPSDLLIKYNPPRHAVANMQNSKIKTTVGDTGYAPKTSRFLGGDKVLLSHSDHSDVELLLSANNSV